MCKLNNIKDRDFIVYRLVIDNYVGVTTDIKPRMNKHRSKSGFNTNIVQILFITKNLELALDKEFEYQKYYKCTNGIRNQTGYKNPFAKKVLHTQTGVFFDTIKEASECFGYNYASVRRDIKQKNNKFNLIRL